MATIIAIVAGVLVLLLVAIFLIARRPTDFRVERSAVVGGSPGAVFGIINDLRQWGRWSPYEGRDPNMKKSYDGPTAGPGASYAWDGNSEVGAGRLTIVESRPGELVRMKLEFTRPFKASNEVNFKLAPTSGGTRVSWIMDGHYNFISKLMSLFMDMDKMIGKDYEQGLANLNHVAGTEAQAIGSN